MSYEPTTWKDGDLVTSAKLNKIEQGIAAGGGILIAHQIDSKEGSTLDKTWQEIFDADIACVVFVGENSKDIEFVTEMGIDDGDYFLSAGTQVEETYATQSADGYPVRNSDR